MNTPFRLPRWPSGTDPRTRNRPGCALAKATVFQALRPKLGGRPLPAAGGQPRRCTGARPNPSLAVGSRDFLNLNSLERTLHCRGGRFQVLSKGVSVTTPSTKGRAPWQAPGRNAVRLLEVGLGAGFLELLLGGLGVGLGNAFLDGLRSAVDEVLGFLQAQAGQLADRLDDLHLVGADLGQHDREFGLLFGDGSSSAAATAAAARRGHRRSRDAELLFDRLDQVVE